MVWNLIRAAGFMTLIAPSGLAFAQPGWRGGRAGFCRADSNNDGRVTLEEALAHGRKMFQSRDKNSDGFVDRTESAAGSRRFEQTDTDRDGRIALAEHEAELRGRFATMDKNADGALTGDELTCARASGSRCRW